MALVHHGGALWRGGTAGLLGCDEPEEIVQRQDSHRGLGVSRGDQDGDVTERLVALDLKDRVHRNVTSVFLALKFVRAGVGDVHTNAVVDLVFELALGTGEDWLEAIGDVAFELVTLAP